VAVVVGAALAGALVLGGAAEQAAPRGAAGDLPRTVDLRPPGTAAPPAEAAATERSPGPSRAGPGGAERGQRPPRVATEALRARPAGLPRAGRQPGSRPTLLRIPSLGVRMPVVPTGVDRRGQMAVPPAVSRAGWYRWGASPGDRRGAVVLAGHVDTQEAGIGPLARVAGAREGARVVLGHRGGSTTYAVTAVRRVPKDVLDLPYLFRRGGAPALHLITCGGEFDPRRGGYEDNVVVIAEPVR
jgi:sortase (surface protein transpeptidase)